MSEIKKHRKQINIYHAIENHRAIVRVPLGNSDHYATLYGEDFTALMDLGVSVCWSIHMGQVKAVADNKPYPIARVLMDAAEGQVVRYLNGDRLDLRRDNLVLARGKSKYRARDLIFKSHRFLPNRPEVKHVFSEKFVKTSDAGSVMT